MTTPNDNLISNITLLSIAGVTITFLIRYLITTKDKNTEDIAKNIKEMKDLLNSNANQTALLYNDFKHNTTSLTNLRADVQELTKLALEHTRKIEQHSSFRGQVEKQLSELEKRVTNIKQ